MIIRIETKHIVAGTRYESTCCPIALAIKEQTGLNPTVGPYSITLYGNLKDHALIAVFTPEIAKKFIRDYDGDNSAQPCQFDLPGIEEFVNVPDGSNQVHRENGD